MRSGAGRNSTGASISFHARCFKPRTVRRVRPDELTVLIRARDETTDTNAAPKAMRKSEVRGQATPFQFFLWWPSDIKLSGERKRARCNAGLARSDKKPSLERDSHRDR